MTGRSIDASFLPKYSADMTMGFPYNQPMATPYLNTVVSPYQQQAIPKPDPIKQKNITGDPYYDESAQQPQQPDDPSKRPKRVPSSPSSSFIVLLTRSSLHHHSLLFSLHHHSLLFSLHHHSLLFSLHHHSLLFSLHHHSLLFSLVQYFINSHQMLLLLLLLFNLSAATKKNGVFLETQPALPHVWSH
jgi:hypothetical protein